MPFKKSDPVGSYLHDVPADERTPERYRQYLEQNNALDLIEPKKPAAKPEAKKPAPKKPAAKPEAKVETED